MTLTLWEIALLILGSGAAGYIFGDRVRAYVGKKAQAGAMALAKKL